MAQESIAKFGKFFQARRKMPPASECASYLTCVKEREKKRQNEIMISRSFSGMISDQPGDMFSVCIKNDR